MVRRRGRIWRGEARQGKVYRGGKSFTLFSPQLREVNIAYPSYSIRCKTTQTMAHVIHRVAFVPEGTQ